MGSSPIVFYLLSEIQSLYDGSKHYMMRLLCVSQEPRRIGKHDLSHSSDTGVKVPIVGFQKFISLSSNVRTLSRHDRGNG